MVAEPDLRVDVNGVAEAEWWSDGSVRVKPSRIRLQGMPDSAIYAAMVGAENESETGERT